MCKEKTVLELIYDERNFYPKPSLDGEISQVKPIKVSINEKKEPPVEPKTGTERIAALKARAEEELDDHEDEEYGHLS